jgi:hypothetical protein
MGHNCAVSLRFWRAIVASVLAPWLVFASTMPPEHQHEADAVHSHSVTHRHFEAHHYDGAEIEHGEGRVIWLDNDLALQQSTYQLALADFIVLAPFRIVPNLNGWILESIVDASPPHGPPRSCTSLRAPPSLSA